MRMYAMILKDLHLKKINKKFYLMNGITFLTINLNYLSASETGRYVTI